MPIDIAELFVTISENYLKYLRLCSVWWKYRQLFQTNLNIILLSCIVILWECTRFIHNICLLGNSEDFTGSYIVVSILENVVKHRVTFVEHFNNFEKLYKHKIVVFGNALKLSLNAFYELTIWYIWWSIFKLC